MLPFPEMGKPRFVSLPENESNHRPVLESFSFSVVNVYAI